MARNSLTARGSAATRHLVLVLAPTGEQPLPRSLQRLEHEYSLAAALVEQEVRPVVSAVVLSLLWIRARG
jgi:hypothetical protein